MLDLHINNHKLQFIFYATQQEQNETNEGDNRMKCNTCLWLEISNYYENTRKFIDN